MFLFLSKNLAFIFKKKYYSKSIYLNTKQKFYNNITYTMTKKNLLSTVKENVVLLNNDTSKKY